MNREAAIAALEKLPSVKVATLRPGDVIVVEVPQLVSNDQAERIQRNLKAIWPNHEAVILSDGLTLSIKREPHGD
jgi:hypothetical protein